MADSEPNAQRLPALVCPDEAPLLGQDTFNPVDADTLPADESEPTDSHALANQTAVNADRFGVNRRNSNYKEGLDLGWNEEDKTRLQPIVQVSKTRSYGHYCAVSISKPSKCEQFNSLRSPTST